MDSKMELMGIWDGCIDEWGVIWGVWINAWMASIEKYGLVDWLIK